MRSWFGRPFIRFLIAGGVAACVNIGSRVAFNQMMPYEVAIIPAYLCGMAVAFIINRYFVFSAAASAPALGQGARFALVNTVALAQVWVVGVGLAVLVLPRLHWAWHTDAVAHVVAVLTPAVTSYFAHKHFSFAE